ncbi:Nn.00g007930.m01.CDS01 [Neocucurbitaria sp. VM-36]
MSLKPCVYCTRPGTLYCQPCAIYDADNNPIQARWYCSPLCKAIDELDHDQECCPPMASSNALFNRAERAGEVAQALFYAVVQNTWTYDVSNIRIVRDQDGDVVAIEVIAGTGVQAGPGADSSCGRHAGGWLVKFPDMAFDTGDQEVKQAVLADQNSIWAFTFMHAAVQALFEDLVNDVEKDIKEVVHYVPNDTRRLVEHKGSFGLSKVDREDVVYPDYDAQGDLKGIYSIALKDGTIIALDLAGAQYSLSHTSVMPWSTYLNRWVGKFIKYRVPFRSHYSKHAEKMSSYRCITPLSITMEQTRHFNMLVTNCKADWGFDLKDLDSMEPQDFDDVLHHLIEQAHASLLKTPQELDEGSTTESFDLRHPKLIENLPPTSTTTTDLLESAPLDIGFMNPFDWDLFRKIIQMPASSVKYQEKKTAKKLQGQRCAYKLPGDWRVVFLPETLPNVRVPWKYVSENPGWRRK